MPEGLSPRYNQVCCGLTIFLSNLPVHCPCTTYPGSPGVEAGVGGIVLQIGIDLDSLSDDSSEGDVVALPLSFIVLLLHLLVRPGVDPLRELPLGLRCLGEMVHHLVQTDGHC